MSIQRILGIDPGLRVTGFGVIERHGSELVYVASGCIRSNDKQALPERIQPKHGKIALTVGESKYGLQERGLSRSIRPDQTHNASFLDLETDVVDSPQTTV